MTLSFPSIISRYKKLARTLPFEIHTLRHFVDAYDPQKEIDLYTQQSIPVKDTRVNFVQIGQGPSLVFVHGLANNWFGWGPLIPLLKQHFTLYLLDLPGFGDSGDLPDYSIEIYAEYISKFIQQTQNEKCILIGLSAGSLVAAEVGRTHPELFRGVILMGPIIKHRNTKLLIKWLHLNFQIINKLSVTQTVLKKAVETRIAAYLSARFVNMNQFNRRLIDLYGMVGKKKMRKQAFIGLGLSLKKYELEQTLLEYPIPVLLLYGAEDKVSGPAYATEVLAQNNLIICESIPDAGHVLHLEKPEETAKAIEEFMSGLGIELH